jgi:hypothetical protein
LYCVLCIDFITYYKIVYLRNDDGKFVKILFDSIACQWLHVIWSMSFFFCISSRTMCNLLYFKCEQYHFIK